MPFTDMDAISLSSEECPVEESSLKVSSVEISAVEALLAISSSAQPLCIKASSVGPSSAEKLATNTSSAKKSTVKTSKTGKQDAKQLRLSKRTNELESAQSRLIELVHRTNGNVCTWHELDLDFCHHPMELQQDFILFPRSRESSVERSSSCRSNDKGEFAYDTCGEGVLLNNRPVGKDDTCAEIDHTKYIPLFYSSVDMNEDPCESENLENEAEPEESSRSGEVTEKLQSIAAWDTEILPSH